MAMAQPQGQALGSCEERAGSASGGRVHAARTARTSIASSTSYTVQLSAVQLYLIL